MSDSPPEHDKPTPEAAKVLVVRLQCCVRRHRPDMLTVLLVCAAGVLAVVWGLMGMRRR